MAREIAANDTYRERLLKHIPSEVLGVFLAVNGVVLANTAAWWPHLILLGIFLAATWLWLQFIEGVGSILQLVMSVLAFLVWAMTIQGPFTAMIPGYQLWIGSIALIVFSGLVAPIVLGIARRG